MRVLLDAFWWAEGPFSNRTVQRELIEAWSTEYPRDELTLLVPRSHLRTARIDAPRGVRLVGTRLRPHGLAVAIGAPLAARRVRADLIMTHNFSALFGKSMVFIHDVLFQTNPEWFTAPERAYFAWMPLLATRATVVLTSSHSEAERIKAQNPRLRSVVPIGLAIRTQLATATPTRPSALPDVYSFVLTVGRLNVRKNLVTTLAAALLSGRISSRMPIVVVGEDDGRSLPLAPEMRQAVLAGAIVILPRVSDAELSWLYGNARLFVFLTLDEGFGLTPIEAVSFGCPCLVSDIDVFHETLGDEVRYVGPQDVVAAAAGIADALDASGQTVTATARPSWAACVHRLREAASAL